jgi:hypothetical protein
MVRTHHQNAHSAPSRLPSRISTPH